MTVNNLKTFYNRFYIAVRKKYMAYMSVRNCKKDCTENRLTKEQKQEIYDYWGKYGSKKTCFHEFYYEKTGNFDIRTVPEDIFYTEIDEFYNDIRAAKYFENKALFGRIFSGIKQPDFVLTRIAGDYYDKNGNFITENIVKELIETPETLFVKKATGSFGGFGVLCLKDGMSDKFNAYTKFIKNHTGDIIVQKKIIQHSSLSKISPNSVNSMRIVSLMRNGEVTVLSGVLRMGIGNAVVDNESSGGIHCGITTDGVLKKEAHNKHGDIFTKHPDTGIIFDNYKIPSYSEVCDLVKTAHTRLPHFKLVNWDVTVDKDGDPVLIEANLGRGGLIINQIENGPLFGELTDEILKEVFGKK